MLNPEDRRAIEGLFDRLSKVERTAEPRDAEAEALIREEVSRQPAAPYYMAQTILVQETALNMAEQRIKELEAQAAERRPQNDFFGSLFGGGRDDRQRQQQVQTRPAPADEGETRRRGPWDNNDRNQGRVGGGGGFLAGAAQTALGVTTGVLMGSAIASMLGAGAANAAEPAADDNTNDANSDQQDQQDNTDAQDTGGDDFGGGDDLGGGDFDFGGDF